MSRIIAEFDRHVDHVLVHSGQNYDYELNQIFFDDLGIRKPNHFLEVAASTAAETIANVIAKSDVVFGKEQPDALLLYGDTNTCLAVIAAKRRKIPVFHMEAGNRCFDERVPEELNRRILDHLSDINLVLTEHARRYLIAEGIRPERIMKTGSHLEEVLEFNRERISASSILTRLNLGADRYFLVSFHREENVDTAENLAEFLDTLEALAQAYNLPVLVSTHPRTQKRLDAHGVQQNPLIRFVKPFGFTDYIRLQMSAFCVLSDSGSITEEASLLNLPAITLRDTHERPEGMDESTVIMSGFRRQRVLEAVRIATAQHQKKPRSIKAVLDYEGGPVSKQVLRIVISYVDYINRTVWQKPCR